MTLHHPARRLAAAAVAVAALAVVPAATALGDEPVQPAQAETSNSARPSQQLQPERTDPTAYEFGETLARLEGRTLEVTFMADIIPHHRAAIEMARLELARGNDPDIRTHAENIIASQQHQIDQFTRWLKQWYGLTPEQAMAAAPAEARAEMAAMERATQRTLASLRSTPAGKNFDVAFVRAIIPHHNSGVIEFLEPQARAVHPQLRVAAATGITTQESEIADFRTWLGARRS